MWWLQIQGMLQGEQRESGNTHRLALSDLSLQPRHTFSRAIGIPTYHRGRDPLELVAMLVRQMA